MLNLGNKENMISRQNAHCDGYTSEEFSLHDAVDIVQFCVHAMGIPELELTQEKLAQVGCRPS